MSIIICVAEWQLYETASDPDRFYTAPDLDLTQDPDFN